MRTPLQGLTLLTLAFSTTTLEAQTGRIILPLLEDATVRSDQPNANFGTAQDLGVGKASNAGQARYLRSYLRFDLSQARILPTVTNAILEITQVRSAGALTKVSAYGVRSGWSEAALTWNNAPTDSGIATGSTWIDSNNPQVQKIPVTTEVNRWLAGGMDFGIVLRLQSESPTLSDGLGWFASKEAGGSATAQIRLEFASNARFGAGCIGPHPINQAPAILQHGYGEPRIGTNMGFKAFMLESNSAAMLAVGLSNTTWAGVPLPLNLTPTCALQVSPDLLWGAGNLRANQISLEVGVNLPNNPALRGINVYLQMASLGTALTLTNGLRYTIY